MRKKAPKYLYNTKFFSSYSPESCYWAGFILTDGCIRKKRRTLSIKVANKDKEILYKFKKSISFLGNVREYKDYSSIDISGNWFVDDLNTNFNIINNKTYTTSFCEKIPIEYYSHYIRGILDGDGCITKTSVPSISFVGTKILLNKLSLIFYDLGIRLKSRNKVPPICKSTEVFGQISYSGKNANKILDWLYTSSIDLIRLDRKYKLYLKLFTNEEI